MITTPLTLDLVRGGAELEPVGHGSRLRLHRLPLPYRSREADAQLTMVERQPSGIHLRFRTTATVIVLRLHATRVSYRGLERARGQVDLVSLDSDAPLAPIDDPRPVWVHHGSSISHGSNAAAPTEIWPVVAARAAGVQLRNLGFGGSAMVDPFLARVIRDQDADLISVKLGINVVNADAMRARAFVPAVHGFLDTIREGHADTPLLVVSPIHSGIHEKTPGPGAFDPDSLREGAARFVATGSAAEVARGALTLEVVRDLLAGVVAARSDDPALHYLDGLSLYGADDAVAHPLPDGLHPDTETHRLIGERFAAAAFAAGAPFGR
ncbi:GDSL-like Lipase/Acylhydrolase family protein [Microbacterium hydrothermale]|uniref:GDSL-type esterase/lipase family protein n=1 Tax=Microbacterium hydrothermale TaxID=857427 RepID=UPI002227F112|nr:SGNH/GDSL hydrolase family protein [Microbacterium hydrothermale]MCW2165669.1 GDSL-like Lipase/Acylhydrolase family protein [Microbacterium hydrothermale]